MATSATDQYAKPVAVSGYLLSVFALFSSYSRRERKSEGEEGNGGEAVELY